MDDLTLIYYTANKINDNFATNVRNHLLEITENKIPIISVSHKPIDFGTNICVGEIEFSNYNVYKQILIGCKAAKTKYIACCEDDTLYNMEHFSHRPPENTFSYNIHRLNITRQTDGFLYFLRNRCGMLMCIAHRDLIIDRLGERFAKFPTLKGTPLKYFCIEPGRPKEKEGDLGFTMSNIDVFETVIPTVTFSHRGSLGGKRKLMDSDIISDTNDYWGSAEDLWRRIY